MRVLDWIIENWFLVVVLVACLWVSVWAVVKFAGLPTEEQRTKIREWLIWACIEAERELQSGTGQLKLREVWNKFCVIPVFATVAKFITFEEFSEWVKEALMKAKEMLINNKTLANYVYGDKADVEVQKLKKQLMESSDL